MFMITLEFILFICDYFLLNHQRTALGISMSIFYIIVLVLKAQLIKLLKCKFVVETTSIAS